MKKYMIGLLVTNKYGVLTRIASLFARRGYNIDTLTVGETVNPQVSRMTIMITGNDHDRDQMIKQLRKLHDVHFVKEMVAEKSVCRELVLFVPSRHSSPRFSETTPVRPSSRIPYSFISSINASSFFVSPVSSIVIASVE